ncbi:MAG: SpoVR family protein [Chloroflexia bacterium]
MESSVAALETALEEIWGIARGFGLDPFPTHFELVPATMMYEFGAYGLPGRFGHWSFGKGYYRMKTQYDYGLSKIYEMVINANPSYAFLMESNSVLQNKLVIAHVLGHTDFFKNNAYYNLTNRGMVESVSLHADRIRKYEFEHGIAAVEHFLDAALSIQEHIDPHIRFRRDAAPAPGQAEPRTSPTSAYQDIWELGVDAAAERESRREAAAAKALAPARVPAAPEKDLLRFLIEHAPDLALWQRDILEIVREEMLYFVPMMQTKILNEGWASYWHARTLRELDLTDEELIEFADLNAGVVAPHRRSINPYHLGLKLLEDIERRWDDPPPGMQALGIRPGSGRAKIFEVRELENDLSLLRNYLTKDLVEDLDLYLYERQGNEWVIAEKDWEKVRDGLVEEMTNFGNPTILVEDADYHRGRELYLIHRHEGRDLDTTYSDKTLQYLYQLWGRPVHLETILDDERTLLSYDGTKNTRTEL